MQRLPVDRALELGDGRVWVHANNRHRAPEARDWVPAPLGRGFVAEAERVRGRGACPSGRIDPPERELLAPVKLKHTVVHSPDDLHRRTESAI